MTLETVDRDVPARVATASIVGVLLTADSLIGPPSSFLWNASGPDHPTGPRRLAYSVREGFDHGDASIVLLLGAVEVDFQDLVVAQPLGLLNELAAEGFELRLAFCEHHPEKGEKDAREIIRLLREGASASGAVAVMLDAAGGAKADVAGYIREMFELLPDRADLNKRERKWLADLRREWVDEAERQYRRLAASTPTTNSTQPRDATGKYGQKQNTPPNVQVR